MPKNENDEDPISISLGESSIGGAAFGSLCDTSQEVNGIQDGEKSVECTETTGSSIMLDVTGETSTNEGNESLGEANMPEGVELDTEGEEVIVEEEKPAGPPTALDVMPSYDSNFTGVLTDVEYNMITGKKINEACPKQSCFNCLGDHNMAQCPLPPNYSKISVNRKKIMGNRVSNVRYHEDCGNKYGQFQPGKMSENLRHALGLRPNQLPLYIYRMRVLGYPPGWLKEAEVHQADVKMYDATGRSVSHPEEEDGEAEPTTVKYKPEKLVSFPGFNDNIPRGVQDESQRYNFPPMQTYHQRTEFLRFMNQNRAETYKKKKLKDSELRSKTPPLSIEMDVEDCESKPEDIVFNPPLPDEEPPPLPPAPQESPSTKRVIEVEDGEITDDSQDSVKKLTAKKQRILKELKGESIQSDIKAVVDSSDGNRESQEDSEDSQLSLTYSADQAQSENSCSDGTSNKNVESKRHHRSHSKGFKLGTMIPDSSTSNKALPSSEKWTVDVSDHIVFDNLPDALGTWDKMKGVMGGVRHKMNILHADEDD